MLRPFIIYFRYKQVGDKKPGAVKLYRLYANDLEEARRLTVKHANYPDIDVISIKQA